MTAKQFYTTSGKEIIRRRLIHFSLWMYKNGYIDYFSNVFPKPLDKCVDEYMDSEMSNSFKTHEDGTE